MKLALISLNQVWEDKAANMLLCQKYIELASEYECDLVIFPEMTLTGFSMSVDMIAEQIHDSPGIKWFREQAVNYHIHVLFGMVLTSGNGFPTNNLLVASPGGEILVNYSKIHLFSLAGESEYYYKGDKPGLFNLHGDTLGVAICYDLRFPELYQALSSRCAMIITIASWPAVRSGHWYTLLKARAIENQSYMCGVNRTGIDGNNINYIRSSVLFDSMGIQAKPVLTNNEMDIFDIDLQTVSRTRMNYPFKKDRNIALYKQLLTLYE